MSHLVGSALGGHEEGVEKYNATDNVEFIICTGTARLVAIKLTLIEINSSQHFSRVSLFRKPSNHAQATLHKYICTLVQFIWYCRGCCIYQR